MHLIKFREIVCVDNKSFTNNSSIIIFKHFYKQRVSNEIKAF